MELNFFCGLDALRSSSHGLGVFGLRRETRVVPNQGLFTTQYNFGTKYARLNLDALSVPEARVQSIRILVAPAVFLEHQWLKS